MPLLTHRRRSMSSSNPKPRLNKGAIIGITIGGLYAVVLILLLVICIRRRRKKRFMLGQEKSNTEPSNQSLGLNSFFDGPPLSRHLVASQQYRRPPTRRPDHRRTLSNGTVMRGASSNPFWMFDGAYAESPSGSLRRHRSESSLSVVIHPTTTLSRQALMPTEIIASKMNAKYPQADGQPSKSIARIRQVTRSPSPSSSVFRNQEDNAFLPPIRMHPLMDKDSIDRIVSGAFETDRVRRENDRPELIRMGTVSTAGKMKIVHGAHGKSLSALSERLVAMLRKSKTGVPEDAE